MVIVVNNNLLLYSRFNVDIWGLCKSHMVFSSKRGSNYRSKYLVDSSVISSSLPYYMRFVSNNSINSICVQFLTISEKRIIMSYERSYNYVYDLSQSNQFEIVYKLNNDFAEISLFQYFYVIFSYSHFSRITRNARRKLGLFESWFMYYLECTLPWFVYSTLFFPDIFESLYAVSSGAICINWNPIPYIYYGVGLCDFVTIVPMYNGLIYWSMYNSLISRCISFSIPQFMYLSMTFFYISLISYPLSSDLVNPFNLSHLNFAGYML